jgi:16S rRNA processing protein RimM
VGRVAGHRGRDGELTVRDCGESVERWLSVRRVWVERNEEGRYYEVEHSRCYRDRWVLKLKGIRDGNAAAQLRGSRVLVAREEAPELPGGTHYAADLVGMVVVDESGHRLGRVERLVVTGGTDVLQVRSEQDGKGEELLIPLAREFVKKIEEAERRIEVRLPAGLRQLNRGSC